MSHTGNEPFAQRMEKKMIRTPLRALQAGALILVCLWTALDIADAALNIGTKRALLAAINSIVIGQTSVVGGTSTCVLFSKTSLAQCDSGFTYAGSNGTVSIGGALAPTSSGSQTLGTSSELWSDVFSNNLEVYSASGELNFNGLNGSNISRMGNPGNQDGVITLKNTARNGFGRLQFGGTSSSFPSLKQSSTTIQVRLADDSGYALFDGGSYSASGTAGVTCAGSPTAGFAATNGIVTHC